jgi:uncharacterized protein with HEPN domain
MHDLTHKDFSCLLNIVESIGKIKRYTSAFSNADELYEDTKSFDAVLMNFVVIGEMAEKLTDEFKHLTEAGVNWFKIRGFRNIIAHNYFGVDAEEVWQIINGSLADLEKNLNRITHIG